MVHKRLTGIWGYAEIVARAADFTAGIALPGDFSFRDGRYLIPSEETGGAASINRLNSKIEPPVNEPEFAEVLVEPSGIEPLTSCIP